MTTFDPVTLAAGGSAIGLMVTLAIVLVRRLSAQGDDYQRIAGGWEQLLAQTKDDLTVARTEIGRLTAALSAAQDEVAGLRRQVVDLRAQLGGPGEK